MTPAIRCWLLHNYTPSRHWKTLTFAWSHVSRHLTDTEAFILRFALFWSQPCDLLPTKWNSSEEWTLERAHQSGAARSPERFLCNTKMGNKIIKEKDSIDLQCAPFAAKPKAEHLPALDGSRPSCNCVCRVGGFLNLEAHSQCVWECWRKALWTVLENSMNDFRYSNAKHIDSHYVHEILEEDSMVASSFLSFTVLLWFRCFQHVCRSGGYIP